MLEVTPDALWLEIRTAEEFAKDHLDQVDDMLEKYTGIGYRRRSTGEWSENHMYEFIRLTTGKIIFDNPRVRVKSRRPVTHRQVALAMQHGLNRWVRDVFLRRLLKRVYVEQCFAYAVVQTVIEPQRWMDPRDGPMKYWPMTYPLERDRWFFDPLARYYGQARYAGHKWVRDKEDLLKAAKEKDEGWDGEQIAALSVDAGIEELKERADNQRMAIRRKEVVGYEVWVPEIQTGDPEEGFHGTIYTLATSYKDQTATEPRFIRKERAYYGPRWGPYTMFGVYPVPGNPIPLAPFAATYAQMRDANDIVQSTIESIRRYKRVVFVSAENPDLARKVKDSPDAFVVAVKGFEKEQIAEMEFGGITEQHITQMKQSLERLDRNTGIIQTHRGQISSRATATEIAVADAASSDMISYIKQEFADSVVQVLKTAAWYLYHDERVSFPLGVSNGAQQAIDEQTGEPMREPWFFGGETEEATGSMFEDLELEIEPYSMERLNEALARAQYKEMVELAIQAAAVIPMTPFYDWERLFQKGGEVLNDPTFSEFFIGEIALQMQQQMAGAAPPGGGGAGSPGGIGGASATARPPTVPLPGQMTGAVLGGIQRQG